MIYIEFTFSLTLQYMCVSEEKPLLLSLAHMLKWRDCLALLHAVKTFENKRAPLIKTSKKKSQQVNYALNKHMSNNQNSRPPTVNQEPPALLDCDSSDESDSQSDSQSEAQLEKQIRSLKKRKAAVSGKAPKSKKHKQSKSADELMREVMSDVVQVTSGTSGVVQRTSNTSDVVQRASSTSDVVQRASRCCSQKTRKPWKYGIELNKHHSGNIVLPDLLWKYHILNNNHSGIIVFFDCYAYYGELLSDSRSCITTE